MREIHTPIAEKQAEGQIEGVVFDIIEKTNTTELHMKNCVFYEEAEEKTYHVGNILVYYSNDSKKSNYSLDSNYCYGSNSNQVNQTSYIQDNNQNGKQKSKQYSNDVNPTIKEKRSESRATIGNTLRIKGTIESFETPRNLGQFDAYFYYRSRNYHYKFYGEQLVIVESDVNWLQQSLREMRNRFSAVYESHLKEKEAGIIKAMVLGEKSGMDKEVKELYQQNGMGHLIAISGLHLTLVAGGVYKVLEKLGSPKKLTSVLIILFIWFYGLMTGFSVSTNRAVVMMILSLIAGMIGRTYDMPTALSISGIIILAQKPMLCMDSGFLLSFGAILGIGVVNPILVKSMGLEKAKGKILLASLSVQIVTLPIILYFFYEAPPYSLILNLIVIPLMSVLLGTALVGGIAGILFPFLPFISRFFMGSVHVILSCYEGIGTFVRTLPFSRMILGKPSIWQVCVYYGLLLGLIYMLDVMNGMCEGRMSEHNAWKDWTKVLKRLWAIWIKLPLWEKRTGCILWLIFCCIVLIPVENWNFNRPELELTFVDVGQGDCIFMRSESGFTCLVDGGSTDEKSVGTYRIIPFLKAKGVGELDYVMVTHADSDHMNGILELLEDSGKGGIDIGNLVLPKTSLVEENYEKLVDLAKENRISIIYIKAGDKLISGKVELHCLHPANDFVTEDTNSYSMVLEVNCGEFKALLTGDLGTAEEERLVKQGLLEDIFLLKVAHHGSKNSSCVEFLEQVQPELSIISCGENNSYGHPHKETLERLGNVGSKVMSTADYGGITVKVEERKVKVEGYAR